ncbi:hypothetical protein DACRYDRAFT_22455 [Dacryopinax primogenitus]|uniref:Purine-cytosine permease n=1 Tax=Dacryopinax primogenitus (strain DJM 731) TaxID=1858805 RepID=M5FZD9_DACPD|nr:uncharacterized protein DACRYDRAFT_22455 [Dacryopinax primogenitus]EJU01230.1 hypothetical protein DACRYDRAFT_22455 [Dacryopinax primogenitus]
MSSSPTSEIREKDLEKSQKDYYPQHVPDTIQEIRPTTGPLAALWAMVEKFDRYGVEVRGIERVKPEERNPTQSAWDACTMWMAANCNISTFSLGTLGTSIFYLSLRECFLCILFFNLLSTLPVAYFSTWGCKLGLRQMTIGRFSFGYYTSLVPVVLNLIACVGWSTINSIVGASVLRAVSPDSDHNIPVAAAIVIIAVLTTIVSLFGYKVVHAYERYSWYPVAVIFIILLGLSAKYMVSGPYGGTGSLEEGNILSFGAAIVGFGLGWSSLAADYTVSMPEKTPSWKIFCLTYAGLNIPLVLIETLGAAMTTVTPDEYQAAFADGGIGGLIGAGLSPAKGFGQFLLVLLALSIVGNNIPNMYSLALTAQVLGRWVQMIPRFFLVLVGTAVYIVLAIVGASHFEDWLDTLLVLLSYWLAIYSTILIEEHFIFRGGKWTNYMPNEYNNTRLLPLGLAALFALCCGIAGAVLGMATVWYVGVLGRLIGDPVFGGDIGFELALGFTAITYPPARWLEKRLTPSRIA